jgi:hypothetical protein
LPCRALAARPGKKEKDLMSANESDFDLDVDPSERTGDPMEASPQDDIELNVDPSEGPVEPPQ